MSRSYLALAKTLFVTLLIGTAWNAQAALQAGKDYVPVSPPQPTETARNNVEVLEFFSYGCPHCNEFEPILHPWVAKLPADVTFRREPVIFSASWAPLAKLYFTAEAMGALDKLHEAAFAAIHSQHVNLTDEKVLFAWVAKQGVDGKKFAEVYNSFAVVSKVQRAKQLAQAYGIAGVPTLVVDGKYQTSASLTGGHAQTLPVLDELIAKARRERAGKS